MRNYDNGVEFWFELTPRCRRKRGAFYMIRKHIYFSGRVQGVGFRYQAAYYARSLGLTGWVRNLSDGRVEMEIQGREP